MSPAPRSVLTIEPFKPAALDAAAALLADRHRRHRLVEPLLDPGFETGAGARGAIESALAADLASGVVARRGDEIVGYLVGQQKDPALWGPNVWVETAGHAATEPAAIGEMYAVLAAEWVAAGRTRHSILVPASDADLVDAWFSLSFGQQHIHAVREVPSPAFGVVPRSELIIRRPTRDDLDALAELELVLPRHLRGSPVFSTLALQTIEEVRAELAEGLDDPKYTFFVAEHDGVVIGSGLGCDLGVSGGNAGLIRPAHAGFLAHAAVFPEARGLGAGRALGAAVLTWARDAGYPAIVTDWRSTNLEADRAWRGLGFRPTFRRLHRHIG
ncbi:MAG TPA: GNAT family N-acetyltransferase [Candidatus Dormibacteraeota bacterium]|nr:GNAT family N-acetyltransferase [Candidatus Dormibacteraeota bacterium]